MPQMFYKAQDGTLIPMGKPGPQGPEGPEGPQGPPGDLSAGSEIIFDSPNGVSRWQVTVADSNHETIGYADDGTTETARFTLERTGGIARWKVGTQAAASFLIESTGAFPTYIYQVAPTGQGHYHSYHIGGSANAQRKFVVQVQDGYYNIFACDDTGNPFVGRKGFSIERTRGRMELGRSTDPADPALTVATKDYVDQWINTPTLMTTWDRTAWPAGTWSELTMTEANSPGTGGSSHSARDCFDQLDSGKPYFRIKKAGLYMVAGTMGWSWNGDNCSYPITGVFRAPANSQFTFGIWASQPNGGPAINRCFGYPRIDGADQTHIMGNTFQIDPIGSTPTSINARLSIIRLGE